MNEKKSNKIADQKFHQQRPFLQPQWVNLFQTNENVYRELVREFFASFEFDASPCRMDNWFVIGKESRDRSVTLSGFSEKGLTVKSELLVVGFWPTIRAVEEYDEDDEGDEAVCEEFGGHEGAGGSVDMYTTDPNDWQVRQARWMDQQDEQWGRLNTWMGQQDERA
ncbi:hypothetical protein Tco_0628005 [Tanacetum coccineum]|uniref:Uncharacterized protein n=1 Tax=Tanacetum coccineum TaxID=301880 RepID=A0ABQ4WP90_9ASTR